METNNYSHNAYFDAFQQYMQNGENEALASYLEGSRPAAFLSVYRNGFIRASASALESNFPCLIKLWGEDYFSQVAASYVKLAPPSSATLIGYGFEKAAHDSSDESLAASTLSFIEYLQQHLSEVVDQYPYVLDICRLDQAWLESLNANGDSYLTLPEVQEMVSQGIDFSEIPLTLVDSSRIVNLEFDIFELWGQLRFAELAEDQKFELESIDNSVIFWQMELQVQAKPLSEVEAVFMQSLKHSGDIDTATNSALEKDQDFDISTLFAELLTAQLLQQ